MKKIFNFFILLTLLIVFPLVTFLNEKESRSHSTETLSTAIDEVGLEPLWKQREKAVQEYSNQSNDINNKNLQNF